MLMHIRPPGPLGLTLARGFIISKTYAKPYDLCMLFKGK